MTQNVLVSSSIKEGLPELVSEIAQRGHEVLSFGGSADTLSGAGLTVTDIEAQYLGVGPDSPWADASALERRAELGRFVLPRLRDDPAVLAELGNSAIQVAVISLRNPTLENPRLDEGGLAYIAAALNGGRLVVTHPDQIGLVCSVLDHPARTRSRMQLIYEAEERMQQHTSRWVRAVAALRGTT
ncbi:hypothetical protein EKI60_01305 [Candidatus Saccharibacteria bacterium]|nr:MAG: hypothetical protein EKI60_01305 [Candidatus Saccharibacteria bacterium]